MRQLEIEPSNPKRVLEKLDDERTAILEAINNPLARLAVRAGAHFGRGPLATNYWQTGYTENKLAIQQSHRLHTRQRDTALRIGRP